MAVIEIGGIVGKADDVIGGIMGLGLDILAVGTIVVSLKPAWEAIKSQSWSDFPMISVPIIISSWFLSSNDNFQGRVQRELTPVNLTNHLLADGIYVRDVAFDTDEWEEEEAENGGYY